MGYETSLELGNRPLLLWRKHSSALPRLLFQHDHLQILEHESSEPDAGDDDSPPFIVRFRARVDEVLSAMDSAGLGWAATLSAYSDVRSDGGALGALMARTEIHALQGSEDAGRAPSLFPPTAPAPMIENLEDEIEKFKALPAEVDLEALGEVLWDQWQNPDTRDLFIFDQITFDGQVESVFNLSWNLLAYIRERRLTVNVFAAMRAIESLASLYQDSPVIAWPMLICMFLHQAPSGEQVTYDLTDDAADQGYDDIDDVASYAAEYWEWSTGALTSTARSMGRLFGVLASFDSKLGREYWFTQAIALHERLIDLNRNASKSTTKTRGDALESLVSAVFRTEEPEFEVLERNLRTREEEIDLLLANRLKDPFWQAFSSPLVLVECKNTRDRPGMPELRIFESKMRDRASICRIGVFVSMSGFASTFSSRLVKFHADGGAIFAVSGDDLSRILREKVRLSDWLRSNGMTNR